LSLTEKMSTIKVSIVVPIYNDGSLAEAFCNSFKVIFQNYFENQDISKLVELIFVNDGSKNDSLIVLKKISSQFNFVKILNLSRNFGQHIALTAGYAEATGNFIGMLNVDMQEHPKEIIKYLNLFNEDNEIDFILGLRKNRQDSFFKKGTSIVFNKLMNKLTGDTTPLNASTLRMMNRKFLNAYLSLNEKSRYLPGLENWLGFKHGFVEIEHNERTTGKSSYNFFSRLRMATNAVLSFSDIPLRFVVSMGFLISVIGFLMIFVLFVQKIFFVKMQPGYTSTISIIVFLGGFQILVIGLASLYIGRILKEVQNRPLYVIKDRINFNHV
jgi:glycosyltransferase involved in cell wall biosynthesis